MTVINSSQSAACTIFLDDHFFDQIFLEPPPSGVKNFAVEAKLSVKVSAAHATQTGRLNARLAQTFQSVVRSKASSKQLRNCELNLIDDDNESLVEVKLHYENRAVTWRFCVTVSD